MNKTVSINLGGLFFHIDEDAYQKLNRYFDAIKRSLSPDGKDEIMSDIEGRIAELLSEMLKNDKQVVGSREVDEVIAVMGQPEDYRIDEETPPKSQTYYTPGYEPFRTKKFYRDGEKGIVAGVCAGLGHYFRIDPLWIRIIFIITLFLSFGTSTIVYVLLWILIPKAITTTEKLEMTGEPINISNIEKKVREEISSLSEKFQNVDYDKLSANAKTGAERVGNSIGTVFTALFNAFAKVIGAIITVVSALSLGGMLITFIIACFSSTMIDSTWDPDLVMLNYTNTPLWMLALLGLFAFGIPMFFLFLLGLKILANNLKPVGSITKYTLLALWIISVLILCYIGFRQAREFSSESKVSSKTQIALVAADTLKVKFRHNDYYAKSLNYNSEFKFTQDSLQNDVIYSNNVGLHILKTDNATPFFQIEKYAAGSSMTEARKRAEKIKYNFEIQGNTLILDNYLVAKTSSQFRNQRVEIYLYLPEGTLFMPDSSVQHYDWSDDTIFTLHDDSDTYVYRMEKTEVKCLNCPEEKIDEDNDGADVDVDFHDGRGHIEFKGTNDSTGVDENVDVDINVNRNGVKVKTTTSRN